MTMRRDARRRLEEPQTTEDGIPRAIAVGPCIEVWAEDPDESGSDVLAGRRMVRCDISAASRYSTAKRGWMYGSGTSKRHLRPLLPNPVPWSVDYLLHQPDRAEQVAKRLAHAGCALTDLPALRREAEELLGRAVRSSHENKVI